MPGLKHRVVHQRHTVIARGHGICVHAERIHTRLRHPAVLIPAFLGGMLIGRAAPVLGALPRLTTRLRRTAEELHEFHAIVTLIATLAPVMLRSYGALADDDNSGAPSSPRQEDTANRSPST